MTNGTSAYEIMQLGAAATVVFTIIGIVWLVLCIVLFFKVWGMTNDVAKIKDTLNEWIDIEHPATHNLTETTEPSAENTAGQA